MIRTADVHSDKILIVDFGSQYTQLIARRVRQLGVYCEIHNPLTVNEPFIQQFQPKGILLSGGPGSAFDRDGLSIEGAILTAECPILGICYGMQILAQQLGGRVIMGDHHEYGHARITYEKSAPLFAGLSEPELSVWMSHGDQVETLPPGFQVLARSQSGLAAMGDPSRHWYGLQFHPEVSHTPQGQAILTNFLKLCRCQFTWVPAKIIEEQITRIREMVGSDRVVLGLSGGVDSAVTAALLKKAIGDQLVCIFVDHGLLRLGEAQQVMDTFHNKSGMKVILVNAQERFLQVLRGVKDPEEKRKIIGREFIQVFEEEARQLLAIKWLAQGTIYPDVIESGGGQHAKVIKSHHNVGGLPKNLPFGLLEPLRFLFKDEVRAIGTELGLPDTLIHRHPFPGAGLAIRLLGAVTEHDLQLLQVCDNIFMTALRELNWYSQVDQAFAVLLPIYSVGVTGDNRRYGRVLALRAVKTTDFMTAEWADLPASLLAEVSRRITNRVPEIARVVYDISSKPPATIEWE